MRGRFLAFSFLALSAFTSCLAMATGASADPDVIIRLGSSSTDGQTVDHSGDLRTTQLQIISERATPEACFTFNQRIDRASDINLESYVSVEPHAEIAATVQDYNLCLEGFAHGETYTVKLLSGLPAIGGAKLTTPEEHEVKIGDMRPSVIFASTGTVLPRLGSKGLPIQTVNVSTVHLVIARINDRNLIDRVNAGNFDYFATATSVGENEGEPIWEGDLLVDKQPNKPVVTALPISETVGKLRPGLYFVTIVSADGVPLRNENDYAVRPTNQWFVVSDVGLSTFLGQDGVTVQVRSLHTTHPLSGVTVALLARNNKVLARAASDDQGIAHFDPGMARGKGGNQPAAVYAYGGAGDFSYVRLGGPALDLSDRGVDGRQNPGPLDVMAFSERGIYRPGETAHVTLLLRDDLGRAVTGLPLIAKLLNPDGTEVDSRTLKDQAGGGYAMDVPFPVSAKSGEWTVSARATPDGDEIGSVSFQVGDFVPPRIEFDLSATQPIVERDAETDLSLAARYLYGAPAGGLSGELSVVLRRAANPYPAFSAYSFGAEQDDDLAPIQLDPVKFTTDDAGKATPSFTLNALPDTTQPVEAVVHASVFDVGGRPVERTVTLPVHSQDFAIGIKPNFTGHLGSDAMASFSVVTVDPAGKQIARSGLNWQLVESFYEYRLTSDINGNWDWRVVERDSAALAGGSLDTLADKPIDIGHQVGDGQFRIEVFDPKGTVMSSTGFYAGWWDSSSRVAHAPDQVTVSSDRQTYAPGDTAHLMVKSPYDGDALFAVVDRGVRQTFNQRLTKDGTVVNVQIPSDAGPGVYVVVTSFAAPDAKRSALPSRAIGTAWLPIDPKLHKLDIAIGTPDEILPSQTLDVPVDVTGAAPGESVYLTLAAVDDGILQLTGYKTPDPLQYYFGKRRLGVDIRDLYSDLIDPLDAKRGAVRTGGDALPEARQLANAPKHNTQVVALYSGIVTLGADGKAHIPLAIPDFNGRLRLMVSAWSPTKVGGAERMLTVHAPIVAELSMPLFMAPGDIARATLSLSNLAAPVGDYHVSLTATGALADEPQFNTANAIPLGAKQAWRGTANLLALDAGDGGVHLKLTGPDGFTLERDWIMTVRPQNPIAVERRVATLQPNQDYAVNWDAAAGFFRETARLNVSVSAVPGFDVPGLVGQLSRDPFWWTSNRVSSNVPLLDYRDAWQQDGLGDAKAQGERMEDGIRDALGMQVARGTFAPGWLYWDEAEEEWLTPFVLDFLTRAREQGYDVPDLAYTRGIRWMTRFVSQDRDSDHDLAVESYAYYVLARAHSMDAGRLRRFYESRGDKLPTDLARAQVGAALARLGDMADAKALFEKIGSDDLMKLASFGERGSPYDYSSPIRDRAGIIAMMAESGVVDPAHVTKLAAALADEVADAEDLSAQEMAWLLYLSADLRPLATPMQLGVDGKPVDDGTKSLFRRFAGAEDKADTLAALHNSGDRPLYVSVSAVGNPMGDLPAVDHGFDIERKIVDRFGNDVDLNAIKQNDLLVVIVEGHVEAYAGGQTTVADMLPAGFEIQNLSLASGSRTDDLNWLGDLSRLQQAEYREDRFVATADITQFYWDDPGKFRMAYMVRAVTPGEYVLPGIYVEDLFRPAVYSRGPALHIKILPN
ncbi:MAG TPA: alpha-2-macroglobulin [Dongiaceae bacterium]|nr:alpha-2-macroglobulin [Dongiaceae bacterium]